MDFLLSAACLSSDGSVTQHHNGRISAISLHSALASFLQMTWQIEKSHQEMCWKIIKKTSGYSAGKDRKGKVERPERSDRHWSPFHHLPSPSLPESILAGGRATVAAISRYPSSSSNKLCFHQRCNHGYINSQTSWAKVNQRKG